MSGPSVRTFFVTDNMKKNHSDTNYIEINRESWNNRVDTHIKSAFYDQEAFLKGKSTLNDIELKLLGDIKGKSILHLQCHFGQDSISMSRLDAKVTGVDFSDKAIEAAKTIAIETSSDTEFICCDIYELEKFCDKQFDIVFTSYGTIGWLPDLDKWAGIIDTFLKPGGSFVFAEFHPVVWMFDDNFDKVGYNYFKEGPIIESESGTYADKNADLSLKTVSWNHSLAEIFGALLKKGLSIESFEEYDYSPYNCFAHTEEFEPGKFRIKHLGNRIPMVYALLAIKK